MDNSGNIRVFCRCRPPRKEELASGYSTVVDFGAAKDGELAMLTGGSTKKIFRFDRVYTPNDDQGTDHHDKFCSILKYHVCTSFFIQACIMLIMQIWNNFLIIDLINNAIILFMLPPLLINDKLLPYNSNSNLFCFLHSKFSYKLLWISSYYWTINFL